MWIVCKLEWKWKLCAPRVQSKVSEFMSDYFTHMTRMVVMVQGRVASISRDGNMCVWAKRLKTERLADYFFAAPGKRRMKNVSSPTPVMSLLWNGFVISWLQSASEWINVYDRRPAPLVHACRHFGARWREKNDIDIFPVMVCFSRR
jgi:hypothetical protein